MGGGRSAAGGGRWVEVAPERLPRWLENFAGRHGRYTADGLTITAEDGATATLRPPPGAEGVRGLTDLLEIAPRPRRIGLLLARKGAVAVGVAEGGEVVASKVDTHYVQGRTAAGGWSQQRFARRRDNQAKAAAAGGAVDAILAARELAPLVALRVERFLDVPEPRHAVLVAAVAQARAVRVLVREPEPAGSASLCVRPPDTPLS